MNEFLATGPFDLYELQLFHLVAEHQSFTKAGRMAGLTQSAITRQIGGMENRLGVRLFERTTRSVRLTAAGAALHARSGAILSEVNEAIGALKTGFNPGPKTLRVGIARSIGLAYLPGFFHQFQTKHPQVQLHVSHETGAFILAALESGELDAGVVTAPPQISRSLQVTHRFADDFVTIAPPKQKFPKSATPIPLKEIQPLLEQGRWIQISEKTVTGRRLAAWMESQDFKVEAAIHADNFDFIVNLVSLGLGISMVPHRVLALHPKQRPVLRIPTHPRFSRDLIVAVRRQPTLSEALAGFVENILF